MSANDPQMPGVSGMSLYVPRYRVPLEQWCAWTGATWPKVEAVVGRSFRICGPDENVYTMAANAVLRLITDYDVDPREVGFLGLGTESSTDNAAGAIIVKGMVDEALERLGKPRLSRDCEVPEYKHACLGGMLGLKGAVRYLRCDGKGRRAIVVCGDLAQYARGSSGEQTQGAGAVAMLLDEHPTLFGVDLDHCGGASDYRGIDFRKPFARHFMADYGPGERMRDFPVFNGRYSTHCYLDAVMHALDGMFDKLGAGGLSVLEDAAGVFLHRPYHKLPQQAMAAVMVRALARAGGDAFDALCESSNVDREVARVELLDSPRLFEQVNAHGPNIDPNPAAQQLFRDYARSPQFKAFMVRTMEWGADVVRELGNLYTASLPAWLAAALHQAQGSDADLSGRRLLAVGYGSGDAAEAVPLVVARGWRDAASRIDMARSLAGAVDLNRAQYEALHDGNAPGGLAANAPSGFVIADVGRRNDPDWQDIGIEYYRFVG
jgi:hydroxymethylglutaryl-CoA synthase